MARRQQRRRRGEEAEVSKQQSTLSKQKNCGEDDGGNGALAIANDGDGNGDGRRPRQRRRAMAMAMDSRYVRLIRISVSISTLERGMRKYWQNSPNQSEDESSWVSSRLTPALVKFLYQHNFFTLLIRYNRFGRRGRLRRRRLHPPEESTSSCDRISSSAPNPKDEAKSSPNPKAAPKSVSLPNPKAVPKSVSLPNPKAAPKSVSSSKAREKGSIEGGGVDMAQRSNDILIK